MNLTITKDTSIVTILQHRAIKQANEQAFTFLENKGEDSLTYAELHSAALKIAEKLSVITEPGEPVLLLCPPGLEYVKAFYGCLYAGRVAVPLYPPRLKQRTDRISKVVANCGANIAITTDDLFEPLLEYVSQTNELAGGTLMSVGQVLAQPNNGACGEIDAETLAFIQYTSGSTGTPKGVMVSHANIVANLIALEEVSGANQDDVFINWLPLFHDLGLINTLLLPVFLGTHSVLMNPASFVQKPLTWLSAIDRFKGTICGAPNFAFDICNAKVADEQLNGLDLSSWKIAFNAAEPINPATLNAFYQKFKECGFRYEAFYPSYGMAEATVFLAAGKAEKAPVVARFDKEELGQRRVKPNDSDGQALVGCGAMPSDHQLLIVEPDVKAALDEGHIGEIWVSGPSIAKGYLGLEERTRESFQAYTSDGRGPFLRTGDLGFVHDGELFISGRIKDIMIIRGRNYYPQDIELVANRSHPDLVPNHATAFSLDREGDSELFLVQEVKASALKKLDMQLVVDDIRRAIAREFDLKANVLLIRPGTLPKTSSGKVQRSRAKAMYQGNALTLLNNDAVTACASTADIAVDLSPVESVLVPLWEAVLRTSRVQPNSDFFALGGDSLDATKLLARIEGEFGFEPSLEALYEYPTVSALASYIEAQTKSRSEEVNHRVIMASDEDIAPLSFSQQRMWFINQMEEQRKILNLPIALDINGELEVERLRAAFKQVIARHAILRTRYHWQGGEALQKIVPEVTQGMELIDLSLLDDGQVQLQQRLKQESQQQLDLENGPVYAIRLFKMAESHHVLSFVVHHIAADAWSLDIFVRELGEYYAKPEAQLAAPQISYADFARWQTSQHNEQRSATLLNYWQEALQSAPALLPLPYDKPRPARQTFVGSTVSAGIPETILAQLQQFSSRNKTTLFVTLLSAFQLQLQRLSGETDILLGTDVANRNHAQLYDLMGFFVNQLVLRQDVSRANDFSELVNLNKKMVLGAMSHQDMPFERIVDEICTSRDPSYSPVFQVKFLLNHSPLHNLELQGLDVSPVAQQETRSQYDLTLSVDRNSESGFDLSFHYNQDLFSRETIEIFMSDYLAILGQVAEKPALDLKDITLASTQTQAYLAAQSGEVRKRRCAQSLIGDIVQQQIVNADKTALICAEQNLSYVALNQAVNKLCHFLSDIDIGPGSVVGVHLGRSVPQIVTLLAVSKLGATFLPLDPDYPAARIAFMLSDSEPDIVITEDLDHEHLLDYAGACLGLDAELSVLEDESAEYDAIAIDGAATAYRIYTSGSTGNPKGVDVAFDAFLNLCDWYLHFADFQPDTVVLQPIPLGFDASIKNIFAPLMAGGTLVLAPDGVFDATAFNQQIEQHKVSLINCVPSMFYALIETASAQEYLALSSLKMVALGGEATDLERLKPWLQSTHCNSKLANIYGPTECTDISVAWSVTAQQALQLEHMPVGKAIDNATVYLLDDNLCSVPEGVAGELFITGAGLSKGYYNYPELNDAAFIANPFGDGLMYRTGDMMRCTKQGVLEYLGRKDDQVKVNGVRIEAGEIESRLCTLEAIACASVMLVDGRLVAWYQPVGLTPPNERQIRDYLAGHFPQNWLPKLFVPIKTMPTLPNGKLDKQALLAMPLPEATVSRQIDPPQNDKERILVDIWGRVLSMATPGVNENFFELGGDSINAVRVVSLANDAGLDFSVADIFEYQTIRQLCATLQLNRVECAEEQSAAFDMLSPEDLALLNASE